MVAIMSILLGLVGLINLGCFIMVLIKLFQDKGIVHGILGILCGLYTFVWGWMNAGRLNISQVMIGWSSMIVLSIVLQGIVSAMTSN